MRLSLRVFIILAIAFCARLGFPSLAQPQAAGDASFRSVAKEIQSVYRITPSIATGLEARKAIARFGWKETLDADAADAILVVVKTFGLLYPLNSTYPTFDELEEDADSQMNISGSIVHLYLYRAEGRGLSEVAHVRYEVER